MDFKNENKIDKYFITLVMDRIEKLKTFLESTPADSFLQHALALEYIKVGDDGEARKLFKEILLREPTYVGSYYHLGKLLGGYG